MIIGLGYKARSGKDTVAGILQTYCGFQPVAFADSLKLACKEVFGFTYDQLHGALKDSEDPYWSQVTGQGLSPRKILQLVGTEAFRKIIHPDIWIYSLKKRVEELKNPNIVITDMRFFNEVEAVKKWGGYAIKIDRPGLPLVNQHVSEIELDAYYKWDYVLENDSTYDHLEIKVKELYRKLKEGFHS